MDQLDYRILSELLKNAQASFAEIARELGTSPYTVGRRYENMKKEGIFLESTVSIDLSKIGYQGKAFLWIAISPQQNKLNTIETLKKMFPHWNISRDILKANLELEIPHITPVLDPCSAVSYECVQDIL